MQLLIIAILTLLSLALIYNTSRAMLDFDLHCHKKSLIKLSVSFFISLLPVIASWLVSSREINDFSDIVPSQDLFIYMAAFLAPVFAILVDILIDTNDQDVGKKFKIAISSFNGFLGVLLLSTLLLIISSIAYSSYNTSPESYRSANISKILIGYEWIPFIIATIFWYLTILNETGKKSGYTENMRNTENIMVSAFSQRVRKGNKDNG